MSKSKAPNGGYPSNIFAVLKIEEYPGYPPVLAGNIRSRDAFSPIAREGKYLMDKS